MSERKTTDRQLFTTENMDPIEFEAIFEEDQIFISAQNQISKRKYENKFNQGSITKMGLSNRMPLVYKILKTSFEKKQNEKLKLYYGYLVPKEGETNEKQPGKENKVKEEEESEEQKNKKMEKYERTSPKKEIYISQLSKREEEGCNFQLLIDYTDEFNEEFYIFTLMEKHVSDYERLTDAFRELKLENEKFKKKLNEQNIILGVWRTNNSAHSPVIWNIVIVAPLSTYLEVTNNSSFRFKEAGLYRITIRVMTTDNKISQRNVYCDSYGYSISTGSGLQTHCIDQFFIFGKDHTMKVTSTTPVYTGSGFNSLSIELIQKDFNDQKRE